MMTQLGNKKNVKIISLAVAGVFVVSIAGYALMSMGDVANAAPASNIGVVDQQQVVSSNTALSSQYQQKMMETADAMQKDFDEQSKNMSEADKEKLFSTMQEQFNQKRQAIEKDIQNKVDGAVKDVASKKGLSLVVDKNAVIYGGTDITKDVSTTLDKSVSAASGAASSAQK
ncbi:MAG TPA: DNA-binding protein [Veillonellaceae bacterium]|nr:DNA-binding protein [Veillonellaceae bacterium]